MKRLLLAAACLLLTGPAAADRPPPAALDHPAVHSVRAARMAMLDIARAGDRLVAVGEAGVVLFSDDHGKSWGQAEVPVSVSLTAVQFIDARLGYATGHMGVVLRTEDGGAHWRKVFDGVQAARLVLEQARAHRAQLSADVPQDQVHAAERALRDAERLVADGPDKPLLGLSFANAQDGFVFGAYNLMFRTTDGGTTWAAWQDRVDNPDGFHLYGMARTGDALVLAGEQGLLLRSTDGGETFVPLASPYKGSFFGITATSGGSVIAYGLRGNAWRSDDRGAHWTKIATDVPVAFSAATRLPDGRMALASQGGAVLIGSAAGEGFASLPDAPALPLSGLTQAGDGTLVAASLAGVQRLEKTGEPREGR